MTHLYAVYDALISINVPNDKARAVVEAMEQDMASTLATKFDLKECATRDDIAGVRAEIQALKLDVGAVKQEVALVRKEFELLSTSMTVRLGSMLVVGLGVLFAALKLT